MPFSTVYFLPKNLSLSSQKYGFTIRDPGSVKKNLFRIPDPGVKKAPDPGSGSATLFINVNFLAQQFAATLIYGLTLTLVVPVSVHFLIYNMIPYRKMASAVTYVKEESESEDEILTEIYLPETLTSASEEEDLSDEGTPNNVKSL